MYLANKYTVVIISCTCLSYKVEGQCLDDTWDKISNTPVETFRNIQELCSTVENQYTSQISYLKSLRLDN